MKPYKPGDTVALVGPLTSGGRAVDMTGWAISAALQRVPDGAAPPMPPLALGCTWTDATAGIARLELAGEATATLAPGHYQIDVILRRETDGFTTTTNTVQIEFVERVTPLLGWVSPPLEAPAP